MLLRATTLALAAALAACAVSGERTGGATGTVEPPAPASSAVAADTGAHPALRLPPDLTFASNPDAPAPVLFRHETHVDAGTPRCTACHPGPFPILRPERRVSHAEMDEGRQCGICHDGRGAFRTADSDACEYCHSGEEGP